MAEEKGARISPTGSERAAKKRGSLLRKQKRAAHSKAVPHWLFLRGKSLPRREKWYISPLDRTFIGLFRFPISAFLSSMDCQRERESTVGGVASHGKKRSTLRTKSAIGNAY